MLEIGQIHDHAILGDVKLLRGYAVGGVARGRSSLPHLIVAVGQQVGGSLKQAVVIRIARVNHSVIGIGDVIHDNVLASAVDNLKLGPSHGGPALPLMLLRIGIVLVQLDAAPDDFIGDGVVVIG